MKHNHSQRNSIIAGVLSLIGLGVTIISCINDTSSAIEVVKAKQAEQPNKELTPKEVVTIALPEYKTTLACAGFTGLGIVGQLYFSHKAQAALTGACCLATDRLNNYRKAIATKYSPEIEKDIMDHVVAVEESLDDERVCVNAFECLPLCEKSNFGDKKLFGIDTTDGTIRYFESTMIKVLAAEYYFNRDYMLGGELAYNYLLDTLGIADDPHGNDYGWSVDSGVCWVDFGNLNETKEDGTPFIHIHMVTPPYEDYAEE